MSQFIQVNIDTSSFAEYTQKLRRLHRRELPLAIRNTLIDVMVETKRLIPISAKRKFIIRNKAFFKAFTGFKKADGFDISKMNSRVGILSDKGGKGSKISEGLKAQEKGGTTNGRKLISTDLARTGNSNKGKVRQKNRFQNQSGFEKATKKDFIRKIYRAKKSGKNVLLKNGSKGTVFKIGELSSNRRTGKTKFNLTPIFTYRNTKKVNLRERGFIKEASLLASRKMPEMFVKQAEFRINRYMQ